MEGQEDAEAQAGTQAEEQNLAPAVRDRTDRALTGAAERELKGNGVYEVLEVAEQHMRQH
jgi:hypothetical protein